MNPALNILFIGNIIPDKDCLQNRASHIAANRAQIGMVKGLSALPNVHIECLTILPSFYFPRDRSILKSGNFFYISESILVRRVPFINIYFIRHFCIFLGIIVYSILWNCRNLNSKRIVISYNLDAPVPQAVKMISNLNFKYVPAIFDLPFITPSVANKIHQFFIEKNHENQIRSLSKVDACIILNENVAVDFNLKKYLVVEGGISIDDLVTIDSKDIQNFINYFSVKKFNILYSGSISQHQGIENLVEAFNSLEKNKFTLTICGRGDREQWLRDQCKCNKEIYFLGVISNSHLNFLQSHADLLIIPQPNDNQTVRYQFPSKIFDYMKSGTVVLTVDLPGLLNEYKANSFVIQDANPKNISYEILKISTISKSDRIQKGNKAKQFILSQKNWYKQSEYIYSFLCKI